MYKNNAEVDQMLRQHMYFHGIKRVNKWSQFVPQIF